MFAVGYDTHFTALKAVVTCQLLTQTQTLVTLLSSAGFKAKAFSKDKAGEITHIIPPKSLGVISTTATGLTGAIYRLHLTNDGSIEGVIEGMTISGEGIGEGATVGTVNTNTRVVTLTASNTGTVNGNVIFGEETSVNWVNIDIQRTNAIATLHLQDKEEHLEQDSISMDTQLKHHLLQLGSKVSPLVLVKMARVLMLLQIKSTAC